MQRGLPELWVCHLGTVEYSEALALQERLRSARQADELPDVLLTLEHWPVYTRGRRSGPGEMPMGEQWYEMQGIEVVQTDRGGKVTYHGPGQLVGYPIVRVDDVLEYVRTLEQALVEALAQEGIVSRARPDEGPDYTGVWVENRKVASIGVHLARGVTTHGFAVNVENDLQPFNWIVPCGLDGVQMTSVIKETHRTAGQLKCFRRRAAWQLAQALGRRQRLVSLARLEARAGAGAAEAGAGWGAGLGAPAERAPRAAGALPVESRQPRPGDAGGLAVDLTPGCAHRPPRGGDHSLVVAAVALECLPRPMRGVAVGLDNHPLCTPEEVDPDRWLAVGQRDERVHPV